MARVAFATRVIDEAGNAIGGSAVEVRIWDDFAATVSSVVTDDSGGGTTIAQPITPNAGTQTTLTVTTLTTDTTLTVASTTGFAVGQLIPIYDGTNTRYRFIRSILSGPPRLTIESAIGVAFSNTNTSVGNPDMQGVVAGWVLDTAFHYIQVKDVASTRLMPTTLIPTMIGNSSVAIQEEGAAVGTRPTINFKGTAITAVDNAPSTRVDVTVAGDFSDQTSLTVGTTAATTGIIRIPNNVSLNARNAGNTTNVALVYLDASDKINIGQVAANPVLMTGGILAIGTTPATAGLIRVPNAQGMVSRNAANTTDYTLLTLNSSDVVSLDVNGRGVGVGSSTVAAAGMIRLPTSPTISNRNAGNTADEQIWPLLTAKNAIAADVTMTVANQFYDGPSVSLASGTWFLSGTVTVEHNSASANITAKLWDGTTVEASTEVHNKIGTATRNSMSLSGIITITSTTTWKISVTSDVGTNGIIKAAAVTNGAGNNASFLRAVRIGN